MREIEISDAKKLSVIHCKCFEKGWTEDNFTEMLSLGDYFGFISDKGFVLGRNILDETEIFAICVLEQFRRRGIASSLLRQFHVKAKELGSKNIFLEVDINNNSAQSLYMSSGYKQISIRNNYYDDRSAIVMQFKNI